MKAGRIGLSLLAAVFILAGLNWQLSLDIPIAQSKSNLNYLSSATAMSVNGSPATGFVNTSHDTDTAGIIKESVSSAGTIIYVDVDATGTATGLSWADAYTNLQDALTTVNSGTEIWVAEGAYYPDVGGGQINDDVSATFSLVDGVELYGGFAATETIRTQRDWLNNKTVLSGDVTTTMIPALGALHTGITTLSVQIPTTLSPVMGMMPLPFWMAFISLRVTLSDMRPDRVIGKDAVGGMHNVNSQSRIRNMHFIGNRAEAMGGGMYNGDSDTNLRNVVFAHNRSWYSDGGGGGLGNSGSHPVLLNITFFGNSAYGQRWRHTQQLQQSTAAKC